ncbi:hypothetical protein ID0507_05770 [Helicobacter pylori]
MAVRFDDNSMVVGSEEMENADNGKKKWKTQIMGMSVLCLLLAVKKIAKCFFLN